jgi:uncharacterized membrane protein YfhO
MRLDLLAPRPKSSLNAMLWMTRAGVDDFRMNIVAPRYSFVVSSIPWWPGWKIERNGRAINPIRVNGAFLGFAVPPGRADVRVWYSPMTFWGGLWLSVATMLTLIALPVWRRRRS